MQVTMKSGPRIYVLPAPGLLDNDSMAVRGGWKRRTKSPLLREDGFKFLNLWTGSVSGKSNLASDWSVHVECMPVGRE